MVDQIEKLNLSTLDKSGWKTYRFDQIAKSIGERVDPTNTDLDIYVGLEHIDSDSIHITRFGKREDVTGTKLRCYPGDVIFGRRRAYQRKAAIIEFDGFCSAHSLVLRANPQIIDPTFFPFFLHSDTFMNRAIDISVGSLSPTINWGTLKTQEFLLPPIDLQKQLAELLWKADVMIENNKSVYENFLIFRKSLLKDAFMKVTASKKLNELPIENINGLWSSEEEDVLPVYVIRSTEIDEFGKINLSKISPLPVLRKQFEKRKLIPNDIVIERSGGGPSQPVGRVCFFEIPDGNYSFSNFTSVLRVTQSQKLDPKFLFYYLLYFYEVNGTERLQKQTTGIRNLDFDLYQMIKVPNPEVDEQKELVKKFDRVDLIRESSLKKIYYSQQLQKSIINQIV